MLGAAIRLALAWPDHADPMTAFAQAADEAADGHGNAVDLRGQGFGDKRNMEFHHSTSISTQVQTTITTSSETSTAALPMSLARLASRWFSRLTRSTTASMAELSNSTTNTSSTMAIIRTRALHGTGRKQAAGISSTASQTSCRKASSHR